jgi:cell division septation protein DedD
MAATAKGKKPRVKKETGTQNSSLWQTRTWIGLIVIISIWMFVFGILVGRGTVSSQFNFKNTKKELYAQAEEADRTAKKSGMAEKPVEKTSADSSQGQKKTDRRPSPDGTLFTQPSSPKPGKKESPPKQSKKSQSKQVGIRPKAKTKKTAPPTHRPPIKHKQKPITHAYQTIQVAAMRNLADAKRMVTRLRKNGYPAYLASAIVSGKGMTHRVRIGPYKSGVKAKNAINQLKKQGIKGLLLKGR